MANEAAMLPCARPELIIRPLGEQGAYVVKNPHTGAYYHLGAEEHFLLSQLGTANDFATVAAAFAERFGEPLAAEELDDFIAMARTQGLLVPEGSEASALATERFAEQHRPRGNLLNWRTRIVDPDRFFTWLAPIIWFFWTPGFVLVSALSIAAAFVLFWLNREEIAASLVSALHQQWQTLVLAWLIWALIIALHESAHGLTCKHFGGEVHEIGFLLLLLMPCFYCNVSDAWLFREKRRRLWVTLAGGYFELFVWSLAVFAWRLLARGTPLQQIAFLIATSSGVRTLFNFNPFVKLDGYYLLSDWAEVPNLMARSNQHAMGYFRWLLWGAARPKPEPHGRFLLAYGVGATLFPLFVVSVMLAATIKLVGARWGWLAAAPLLLLSLVGVRRLFHGFTAGEVSKMMQLRRKRAVAWGMLVAVVVAALWLIQVDDQASGSFVVRSGARAELRAPVACFLLAAEVEEGEAVYASQVVARLEVPDLESRIAQKRAEVREAQSRLKLLLAGTRPEQIHDQEQRVQRARAWRNLAEEDLARSRKAMVDDLQRIREQIEQHDADLTYAIELLALEEKLSHNGTTSRMEYGEALRQRRVASALKAQALAQKHSHEILGCREGEMELARRDKELADAEATLSLLTIPPRSEEVQAEKARMARLEEEGAYLTALREKLVLTSPIKGIVCTPHLKDKHGQFFKEGELICQVEDLSAIEAEISLPEEQMARVRPGQPVTLKVRSQPFQTYTAQVLRAAPAVRGDPNLTAGVGEVHGVVCIYCRISNDGADLQPGMNGHARISTGQRSAGGYLLDRLLRYVRTEFWW